jgi:hypothetical protein
LSGNGILIRFSPVDDVKPMVIPAGGEILGLEAYRSHALAAAELGRLLGFESRMQVDLFLKEHEVYDFTAEDFEQDRETLRQLRARGALY